MARSATLRHRTRFLEIPLFDVNGDQDQPITLIQARRMVLNGDAVPCVSSGEGELPGWAGRSWRDWPAIKRTKPKKQKASACELTEFDMISVSGLHGGFVQRRVSQQRVEPWPDVHDTHAVTVQAGKVFIPSQQAVRARSEQRLKESTIARLAEQQQAAMRLRNAARV
jgi:hypothetical protein